MPCLSCSEDIPVWENFCAECGADQKALIASRVEEFESQRSEAEQHRSACVYESALESDQQESEALIATISDRLNFDSDSPLKQMIRTPTCGAGVIQDNAVLNMIKNSVTDGILYDYDELEDRLEILKAYWGAVKVVFPDAWGESARKSRLMHSVGIVSMGFLMDVISAQYARRQALDQRLFERELRKIAEDCRWTSGHWEELGLKWNEVSNVSSHILMLSNELIRAYTDARRLDQ